MILTLRTDKPEAEIGLYSDDQQQAYETWAAHRQLTDTLLIKIEELLKAQQADWAGLTGLIVFSGPGSFTGLRIGATVANALAFAQQVPVVATKGDDWITLGLQRLAAGENDKIALLEYGGEANISTPRK